MERIQVLEDTNNLILTVFDGAKPPYVVDLNSFGKQTVTFGRSDQNDIVLDSDFVSKFHGHIGLNPDEYIIYDNNSMNGLHVNGKKMLFQKLNDGDQISIYAGPVSVSMIININRQIGKWRKFDLSKIGTATIGRSNECNIRLNHVSVSRIHAKITKEMDGYFLIDNNSTNGVYIQGKRIVGRYKLNESDIITIVNSKLTFRNGCIEYIASDGGIGIEAVNVVKTVKSRGKDHNIVSHVSVSIKPCEFVAIIGGSGTGKSSFLKCLCGFSKTNAGNIRINEDDLYENFDALKCVIGYVPQQDIVHGDLPLKHMLIYAAQMRMPKDTTMVEIESRVKEVISMVELNGREDTLVRQLSGGQRKRASIAVEMLSDPGVFFLDEPTSGLDPGTEKNLMYTLRKMTDKEKTVILVTHNTMNINLCDKVIILGFGGCLCFYGTPTDALKFFSVDDFIDIYNIINTDSKKWEEKFKKSGYNTAAQSQDKIKSSVHKTKKNKSSSLKQFTILSRRYFEIMINDRRRFVMLMLQAPLIGFLLAIVSDSGINSPFQYQQDSKAILFSLSCAAFWVGMLNSIQEICKERVILERELMTNMKVIPYICSKLLLQGGMCIIQSVLMVGILTIIRGQPIHHIILPTFLEMVISTFLATYAASTLGLLVSAFTPNADRAMSFAPLLLMPQILFSGIIFELKGFIKYISIFASNKWAMKAYSATAQIDNLLLKSSSGSSSASKVDNLYDYVAWDITKPWIIMGIFILVSAVISVVVLSVRERE